MAVMSAMDLTIMETRIAWAMPVKPDKLVQQLQRYKHIAPAICALQLCHRFGQGPDVHITKLPLEVEQLIEDLVFHHNCPNYGEAPHFFSHFENRCEPVDHLSDGYDDILDDAVHQLDEPLCQACKSEEVCCFSESCSKKCEERANKIINERLYAYGDYEDECHHSRLAWLGMISQGPKGDFVEYDKLLLKHFGVKAYFANTRAADGEEVKWPPNPNDKWHPDEPTRTTICYLTLPNRGSKSRSYSGVEVELDAGASCIDVAQSSFVDLPDQRDRKKRVRQFKHVLRGLRLKPYIHPSQLTQRLSTRVHVKHAGVKAEIKDKGKDECTEEKQDKVDDTRKKEGSKVKDATKIEWPQLIMHVEASTE